MAKRDKSDLIRSTYDQLLKSRNGFNVNNNTMRLGMMQRMHIRQFTELSCNRFEWVGLPDGISQRFLELELFTQGSAVFVKEPKTDKFMVLRGGASGVMDYQDEPTKATYSGNQAFNGTSDIRDEEGNGNALVIYSNYTRIPDLETVYIYAEKLANVDMTIEINAMSARLTKIVKGNEKKLLSHVNIQRKVMEGEPLIFVGDNYTNDDVSVMDLGIHPDMIVSMQSVRAKLWNEAMTLLGINNANQDKKERMVADEVGANDDQINAHRAIAMKMRRDFAEKANELFGLNISVHFSTDDQAIERARIESEIIDISENEEGELENGELHDGTEERDSSV